VFIEKKCFLFLKLAVNKNAQKMLKKLKKFKDVKKKRTRIVWLRKVVLSLSIVILRATGCKTRK
jgi:hypothetical protein